MLFIFSTTALIRHLRHLKTVVFLPWCLMCAVPVCQNHIFILLNENVKFESQFCLNRLKVTTLVPSFYSWWPHNHWLSSMSSRLRWVGSLRFSIFKWSSTVICHTPILTYVLRDSRGLYVVLCWSKAILSNFYWEQWRLIQGRGRNSMVDYLVLISLDQLF